MELDRRFHWEGRDVAWTVAGAGPPVVFCHGTPFSSRVWWPFAEALAADHEVYVWDMPGYGQSSMRTEDRVDFDAHGRLLAALLRDAWRLDAPHVVAHDFGGAVSLRATLLEGASYASLLLADVVALPPTGSPFFRFVGEHPGVLAQLPAYVHRAIVRAYITGASHRGLRDEDLEALVQPWTGDTGQGAFYRQIEQTDERYLHEVEAALPGLELPVRILWGADDAWIDPDVGARLRDAVAGATLGLVPGAGHLIQYDQPVALMSELRAWLARVAIT